jgi:hypothetical protein
MKIIIIVTIINSIFLLVPGGLKSLGEAQQERENIRNAILAGSWYPGNKDALTKRIEGYSYQKDRGLFIEGKGRIT